MRFGNTYASYIAIALLSLGCLPAFAQAVDEADASVVANNIDRATEAKNKCSEGGQSDMNICLSKEYKRIDKELNAVYAELIKVLEDPRGIRDAQRAWIKYRDTECSNKVFQLGESGSLVSFATNACKIEFTEERIKHLKWHLEQDCNACPERK